MPSEIKFPSKGTVTNEIFTRKHEPPEDAIDWRDMQDEAKLPNLTDVVFENCQFNGFWLCSNCSVFINCTFRNCLISGQMLVLARGENPKENFIGCNFVDCGICGQETFPSDTYNGVIRYYVGKGKPLVSPSCTFNTCEFGAIFERVVDFSKSQFINCKVCSKFTPHGKRIFPDQGVVANVQEFYPDVEWKDSDFHPNLVEAAHRADEWSEENPKGDAMGGQPEWVSGVQNLLSESE